MSSEDFKREFNISAKIIYREWLMDAIEHDAYESFKDCVLNLGTEWHVLHWLLAKKVKPDDFCKNLWNNRKNIQNGTYSGWAESPYKAYSYESKVCFLINPQYYKLIYDSNNKETLHEETDKRFTPIEWQDAVDKYYEKHKEEFHKSETDVDKYYKKYNEEFLKSEKDVVRIFEIDYKLWIKGKQLRQDKS